MLENKLTLKIKRKDIANIDVYYISYDIRNPIDFYTQYDSYFDEYVVNASCCRETLTLYRGTKENCDKILNSLVFMTTFGYTGIFDCTRIGAEVKAVRDSYSEPISLYLDRIM